MWGAAIANRTEKEKVQETRGKTSLYLRVSDASRQAGHTMLSFTFDTEHSVEGICEGPTDLSLDIYCLNPSLI